MVFDVTERSRVAAVRAAREARDVAAALARELAVSPATLSAVENGHTLLTVDRLQQIADLLDVPPAWLLSGDLAAALPVASVSAGDWRSFDGIAIDSSWRPPGSSSAGGSTPPVCARWRPRRP